MLADAQNRANSLLDARPLGFPLAPALLLIAGLLGFRYLCLAVGVLPEPVYFQPSIALESIKAAFSPKLRVLAPCVFGLAVLVIGRKGLTARWSRWECGGAIRAFAIASVALLVWTYALMPHNTFFDRWHFADRLLLVAAGAAVWWRPAFVIPFSLLGVAFASQLIHPIGGYSWAMADPAFHLLMLFGAFVVYTGITRRDDSRLLLFLAACLIAAHYTPSGLTKLRTNWLVHDQIEFLLPNAHANGWLRGLSPEALARWTGALATISLPGKVLTLVAECGSVLLFWRRRTAMLLVVVWTVFHIGVFAASGIFFWQWLVLDAVLFVLLWKRPEIWSPAFRPVWFAFALALIGTSKWWFKPVSLTWFDTPVSNSYRFYATIDDGTRHHLPPEFFAPYEYVFSIAGFQYLCQPPALPITLGATSKANAKRLAIANSEADVLALESEIATDLFDAARRDRLASFLQTFITNANDAGSSRHHALSAPPTLWTSGDATAYSPDAGTIEKVEVEQVLTFYDGEHLRELRTRKLLEVEIP